MTDEIKDPVTAEETVETPETTTEATVPPEEAPEESPAAETEAPKEKKKHKDKKADAAALAAAQEEVKRLEQKLEETRDAHLRTLAEYENYRKRSQKEKDNIYPEAVASTVNGFLPVLDTFERAMASTCSDPEFFKGMGMILSQFTQALERLDIHPIGEVGEPFDPEKHNAVMHIEDENLGENVIAAVFQKGYVKGDKVIRCAMVQVAN